MFNFKRISILQIFICHLQLHLKLQLTSKARLNNTGKFLKTQKQATERKLTELTLIATPGLIGISVYFKREQPRDSPRSKGATNLLVFGKLYHSFLAQSGI